MRINIPFLTVYSMCSVCKVGAKYLFRGWDFQPLDSFPSIHGVLILSQYTILLTSFSTFSLLATRKTSNLELRVYVGLSFKSEFSACYINYTTMAKKIQMYHTKSMIITPLCRFKLAIGLGMALFALLVIIGIIVFCICCCVCCD